MSNELIAFGGNPPEGEYINKNHGGSRGKQLIAKYPNGYGASVIQSHMSYGGGEGKFELAVLHGFPDGGIEGGSLCYSSPITNDVRGWLTQEMVIADLIQISELPQNDECDHSRRDDYDPFDDEDEHQGSFMDALNSLSRGLVKE